MLGITSLIAPNGRTAMKAPRVSFSPALTTTLSCNTGHRADAGFQYVQVPFMAGPGGLNSLPLQNMFLKHAIAVGMDDIHVTSALFGMC